MVLVEYAQRTQPATKAVVEYKHSALGAKLTPAFLFSGHSLAACLVGIAHWATINTLHPGHTQPTYPLPAL